MNPPKLQTKVEAPSLGVINLCEFTRGHLKNIWCNSGVKNAYLVTRVNDPRQRVPSFDLPRSQWTTLHWIRTDKSRYQHPLHTNGC